MKSRKVVAIAFATRHRVALSALGLAACLAPAHAYPPMIIDDQYIQTTSRYCYEVDDSCSLSFKPISNHVLKIRMVSCEATVRRLPRDTKAFVQSLQLYPDISVPAAVHIPLRSHLAKGDFDYYTFFESVFVSSGSGDKPHMRILMSQNVDTLGLECTISGEHVHRPDP